MLQKSAEFPCKVYSKVYGGLSRFIEVYVRFTKVLSQSTSAGWRLVGTQTVNLVQLSDKPHEIPRLNLGLRGSTHKSLVELLR